MAVTFDDTFELDETGILDQSGSDDDTDLAQPSDTAVESTEEIRSTEPSIGNPVVDVYRKELADDLRLTNDDRSLNLALFREKVFMEAGIRGKWLTYLYKEKANLAKLVEKKDELSKAITDHIMSGSGSGFDKRQKVEEELKKNPAMKKCGETILQYRACIDFLTEANDIMSKFGYSIRNGIDFLKLEFH